MTFGNFKLKTKVLVVFVLVILAGKYFIESEKESIVLKPTFGFINTKQASEKSNILMVNSMDKINKSDMGVSRLLSNTMVPDQSFAKKLKIQSFKLLLQKTLIELPELSEVQNINPREFHLYSPLVKKASVQLSGVAEVWHDDIDLKPMALEFYKECASQQAKISVVRAYCFNKAIKLNVEIYHQVWMYDPRAISMALINLAKQI